MGKRVSFRPVKECRRDYCVKPAWAGLSCGVLRTGTNNRAGRFAEKYFFPWLKKIGDLAKRYNKPLIYHTDGILYDIMDRIIGCGVDAIHPIEPKAMDLAEVKQRYGDQLCLIGNIDVDLLARGKVDEIRTNVIRNIREAGYNGGYCVGSGNSIPEYVKLENYIAMIETVKEINSKL